MKQHKKFYTDGVKTIKLSDTDEIPNGFHLGRTFKSNPWNKGLTKDTDERVKINTQSCHKTRREKNNYISWNTGLTKDKSESLRVVSEKLSKYKLTHPMTQEQKDKMNRHIYETKRKNNSFNISKPEKEYYGFLCEKYGKENVIRQYKESRYPFNCDFYIPSEDLFIECNFSWCHGCHPFNSEDKNDLELLQNMSEKSLKSSYYKCAIKVWTITDPLKLQTMRKNKLNFTIIYRNNLIISSFN